MILFRKPKKPQNYRTTFGTFLSETLIIKRRRTNDPQRSIWFELANVSGGKPPQSFGFMEILIGLFRIFMISKSNVATAKPYLTTWTRTIGYIVVACTENQQNKLKNHRRTRPVSRRIREVVSKK